MVNLLLSVTFSTDTIQYQQQESDRYANLERVGSVIYHLFNKQVGSVMKLFTTRLSAFPIYLEEPNLRLPQGKAFHLGI